MKTLLLIVILMTLASCGGGGGGSKPGQGSSKQPVSTECLEEKLHWLSNPPETVEEAKADMNSVDFETCEGIEAYSQKVMKAHPQLNF